MSTDLGVRPATREDLPAIVALLQRADLPVDGVDGELVEGMAVAESRGTLVGCAAIERLHRSGLLRSVVVEDAWRGSGLGARLVRDRLAWARGHGIRRAYLLTTTTPAFFARLGFEAVAREDVPEDVRASREFAVTCPESAVVMTRSLDPRQDVSQEWESGRGN